MRNDIVACLFVLLLLIIIFACVEGKRADTARKRTRELRRQHERLVDHKVRISGKGRFDCPACGSTVACRKCELWCYHAERGTDSKDL